MLIAGFIIAFVLFGLLVGVVWSGGIGVTDKAKYFDTQGKEVSRVEAYQMHKVYPSSVQKKTVRTTPLGINWSFSLTVAIIASAVATGITLFSFYSGTDLLMMGSRAREIEKKDDPQLFNVVEEMSIASGLPMPRVFVIDSYSMNAFATGRDPNNSAVAVTTGLRDRLTRDELQGVIAHEMSHIKHYDIRYGMLMAVLVGTLVLLADIFLRSLWFGAGSRRRDNNSGGGALQIILIVIAILLAILAPILAKIIQLALSRQREYLADAGAVKLTRNPEGIASALEKLGSDTEELTQASRATEALYITNPVHKSFNEEAHQASLFDTHPPIAERVRRIRSLTY